MIAFNEAQLAKIRTLNPLYDSKFVYDSQRWDKLNPRFQHLIEEFENAEISRQDVIDAYKQYYTNGSNYHVKAFLLTMVWGFGDTGYGTHRTNKYLSEAKNLEVIQSALDIIMNRGINGLKDSFKLLKGVDGLGVSYITKVLYFATRAAEINNYALIFDIRVASALVRLTAPREVYEILNVSPSQKFTNYQRFNSLIHQLSSLNKVEADQIELYLFNQNFE